MPKESGRRIVRSFMTRWFQRFASKKGNAGKALHEAVARDKAGRMDADLGGEVIKQRIARPGEERSKSLWTIILFRRGDKTFFSESVSKSERASTANDEERQCKEADRQVLALMQQQIAVLRKMRDFVEANADEQKL